MTPRKFAAAAAGTFATCAIAFGQAATTREGSMADLQREIAELRQRLADLESRAAQAAPSGLEEDVARYLRELPQPEAGGNVSAPGVAGITIGGDLRFRGEYYNRRTFSSDESTDYEDRWLYRVRVNLGVDVDEYTKAFIQVMQAGTFGTDLSEGSVPGAFGADPTNPNFSTGATGNGGGSVTDELHVRQAFLDFNDIFGSGWDLRGGRQVLEFGDGRILGENDWEQFPNVFDGAKLSTQFDELAVDVFAVKLYDDFNADPTNESTADVNLYGGYLAWAGDVLEADGYVLAFDQGGSSAGGTFGPAGNQLRWTVGTRLAGDYDFLDWGFEIAAQQNERTTESRHVRFGDAYGIHGEVGLSLAEQMEFSPRVYASYDRGSDDWQNIAPNFHPFAGVMDIVKNWENLIDYAVGLDLQIHEDWTIGGAWHWFQFHNQPSGVSGMKNIGQEVDVVVSGKCTERLNLDLGYGHFFADEGIEVFPSTNNGSATPSAVWFPSGDDDDADFVYVQLGVPF
jgi:hypothetical protein